MENIKVNRQVLEERAKRYFNNDFEIKKPVSKINKKQKNKTTK